MRRLQETKNVLQSRDLPGGRQGAYDRNALPDDIIGSDGRRVAYGDFCAYRAMCIQAKERVGRFSASWRDTEPLEVR